MFYLYGGTNKKYYVCTLDEPLVPWGWKEGVGVRVITLADFRLTSFSVVKCLLSVQTRNNVLLSFSAERGLLRVS